MLKNFLGEEILWLLEKIRDVLELGGSLVDPSILAGGIWTALLTTAMGLIVAIPALISHYFLEKEINNLHSNLDNFLNKLSDLK